MVTTEEIYENMRKKYREITGRPLSETSDMAVRMYAAAAEINSLYAYGDWLKSQAFPQTATGECLDSHGQMRGLTRQAGKKAQGSITFYAASQAQSDMLIPAGTVCYTQYGTRFLTTSDAVILKNESSVSAQAECETEGECGNVSAEEITLMAVKPVGVSYCLNENAFTEGKDPESDESLRARIIESYKSLPNGANEAYYKKETLQIEGVADVKVLPKNRGIGTVDIVISAHGGLPDEELKNKVKSAIDAKREICVDIGVLSPESENIAVKAKIKPKDGYEFSKVSENVQGEIEKYFSGTVLGQNILKAKLCSIIYGAQGVENYELLLPQSDIYVSDITLPILSGVELEEMGA